MTFRISQETLQGLAEYSEAQFLERMTARLAAEHSEVTDSWSPVDCRKFVERWVTDARAFRITLETDIWAYLNLVAQNSVLQQAPRPEWVTDILQYPNRTGGLKVELLEKHLFWKRENQ